MMILAKQLQILAALRAGARQIQGTLNGLGERCGNADYNDYSNTPVKAGICRFV